MSPELYGFLSRVHGEVGALGLAVLLHPVITLRVRRRASEWTRRTADLGVVLLSLQAAAGVWLYGTYRARVKPALWLGHPAAVLRFETKEHLSAMAVALAIGGAVTLRIAHRSPVGRDAAWIQLLLAFSLGLLSAILGIYVGGSAQPGW